ncbi:MAG: YecA family protein [Proteobacteria bacterium]|nr:MAG: YecA family protein [Pseudomonadota bacterium]
MDKPIDYNDVADCIDRGGIDLFPSEIHGVACGLLSANNGADKIAWVRELVPDLEAGNVLQTEAIKDMGRLFELAQCGLQDSELRFELFLPEDDASLAIRVEALQDWCQGFLMGMTMAGVKDYSALPEDSRDLLEDFANIGASGEFDLEDKEESEIAFTDISQYVRLGVLLINEELQPMRQSATIH